MKKIEDLKAKLDEAQSRDSVTAEEELALKWQLCAALREDEIFWKQKSRALWLREGDRNTKFFHATTKQRRAQNRITSIKDRHGATIQTEEGIVHVAVHYFQELFTEPETSGLEEALQKVQVKVTTEQNAILTCPPSDGEIKSAYLV